MTEGSLLGHAFADQRLLEQALTHRSASHVNNERLEFLGDALVNLFVAELIHESLPRADEGEMTRLRAALVNGSALAAIAREAEVGDRLRLGPGELKSGGFRRESILADAFEALVAAVYLDAGWEACRDLVRRLFGERVRGAASTPKDAKTRLQEYLQARNLALPVYDLVAARGEDHARSFDVTCSAGEPVVTAAGSAGSRRAAEQLAAAQVLEQLEGRRHAG
ncbi:MAG TPA: ribonuclease III [Dokdonella sp.]